MLQIHIIFQSFGLFKGYSVNNLYHISEFWAFEGYSVKNSYQISEFWPF